MEISRKTDYALRMMAALVLNEGGTLAVRQAAADNGVPYSFARSIQHDLVRAGLVDSVRGSRGGMKLKVDPEKITLLQLVEAVQGPIQIATCDTAGENNGPCTRMESCGFNPIWRGACALLCDYFSSVTLADIVYRKKAPSIPRCYWGEHAFEHITKYPEIHLD